MCMDVMLMTAHTFQCDLSHGATHISISKSRSVRVHKRSVQDAH